MNTDDFTVYIDRGPRDTIITSNYVYLRIQMGMVLYSYNVDKSDIYHKLSIAYDSKFAMFLPNQSLIDFHDKSKDKYHKIYKTLHQCEVSGAHFAWYQTQHTAFVSPCMGYVRDVS